MIYLLISIAAILSLYLLLIFLVIKRVITWGYKSLIYGLLTFIMLVSIFLTFACYEKNWKEDGRLNKESSARGFTYDKG
jgi:glucan phosphoethanolaminetransferase (alkaline phosphatase superfamily)